MVITFDSSRRPCDSEALATSSYEMNFAQPLSDDTLVRAAVSVVLPWSMWPMVPTFTCGLLRSNFSLAMSSTPSSCLRSTVAPGAAVDNLRCRSAFPTVHLRIPLRWTTSANGWLANRSPLAESGGGWSRCPGSNWRPRPYQGRALPTELHRPSPYVPLARRFGRQVG